jgi:hypothetical protein
MPERMRSHPLALCGRHVTRRARGSLEHVLRFVARIDGTVRIAIEWSTRRARLFAPVRK